MDTAVQTDKWVHRFLALADHIAEWSKDPSTKVGAVIVRPNRTIASIGYNGLPRDIEDNAERLRNRDVKYEIVVHAEDNALLMAREPLNGYSLFVTMPPCSRCAARIIQSGIKHVYCWEPADRWRDNCVLGANLCVEAGITTTWMPHNVPSNNR